MLPADDRVLALEGIHNFRDYGGYPTADGGRVRKGALWRSGQHCNATPDDLAEIARLGLRTVIDLRGDSERQLYPCLRPEEFAGDVIFAPGETAGLRGAAVHEESASQIRTAGDAQAAMVRLYRGIAWRPVLVGTLKLYFEALAERASPSLLHCLAGKDRTGVAAALAHHVLRVHPDDAMADYLLTNVAGNLDRRIAAGTGALRANLGREMEDEAVRTLMSVRPEYLTTALDAIRERHGSVDAYLFQVLDVTPERAETIRNRLVE